MHQRCLQPALTGARRGLRVTPVCLAGSGAEPSAPSYQAPRWGKSERRDRDDDGDRSRRNGDSGGGGGGSSSWGRGRGDGGGERSWDRGGRGGRGDGERSWGRGGRGRGDGGGEGGGVRDGAGGGGERSWGRGGRGRGDGGGERSGRGGSSFSGRTGGRGGGGGRGGYREDGGFRSGEGRRQQGGEVAEGGENRWRPSGPPNFREGRDGGGSGGDFGGDRVRGPQEPQGQQAGGGQAERSWGARQERNDGYDDRRPQLRARDDAEDEEDDDADEQDRESAADYEARYRTNGGSRRNISEHGERGNSDPPLRDSLEGEALYGVFPVLAALRARRRKVYRAFMLESMDLAKRKDAGLVRQVEALCQEAGVQVVRVGRHELNLMSQDRPHQGLVVDVAPLDWTHMDEFPYANEAAAAATTAGAPPPVWLALDEVVDPQNLGAVVRSALCLGATGVLACSRNCAPLSPVVSKASAGALEALPLHSCHNLPRTLLDARDNKGWAVLGAAAGSGSEPVGRVRVTGPTILVLGSEGFGLRTNTRRACSGLVRVDMAPAAARSPLTDASESRHDAPPSPSDAAPRQVLRGLVDSLNVSVATGILLHALLSSAAAGATAEAGIGAAAAVAVTAAGLGAGAEDA